MKLNLEHITKYPFDKSLEQNIMHLVYVCFAGKQTLEALDISIQGYRTLDNGAIKCNVLICYDPLYNNERDTIHCSDSICYVLRQTDAVIVKKIYPPFSINDIQGYYLPQIPIADQIYIEEGTIDLKILTNLISKGPFLIQQQLQYLIDFQWLNILEGNLGNWKNQLFINRKISENKSDKIKNYLIIRINTKEKDLKLFVPSKTKITSYQSLISKPRFYKSLKLPQIYEKIFETQPYQCLQQELLTLFKTSSLITLKYQKGTGLSSYLRKFSQRNNLSFQKINCNQIITLKQIYQKIRNLNKSGYEIIYLKNIQWLEQICKNHGNLTKTSSQALKNCLKKIQQYFLQGLQLSYVKYKLIISYTNNQCQGFTSSRNIDFIFEKYHKEKYIRNIIQGRYKFISVDDQSQKIQQSLNQEIVNNQLLIKMGVKVGWTKFLNIYQQYKHKPIKPEEIIEKLQKYTQIQKVQNIANVSWDDIGGLETAKEQIIQTILLPTKHPQIFDQWITPRTGLLFYGPPGTGKTMLGKCIANQCKMGFISVKGPQLLNMYIGESQKNLRQVFERAMKSKPCIIFMDQLDALVPKRGNSNDSNQVMDRIVAELLTQMDFASQNGIFIIGATNRPDLLDPSILRPGRFDKQIYLGISKDKNEQKKILEAQTRNIKLEDNMNFQKILESIPSNFTGADFYGLTSKAIMHAMERIINQYENNQQENINNLLDSNVVILENDFLEAAKKIVPSVSLKELQHYENLKQKYS